MTQRRRKPRRLSLLLPCIFQNLHNNAFRSGLPKMNKHLCVSCLQGSYIFDQIKCAFSQLIKVRVKSLSRVSLFETPWTVCSPPGSPVPGILQARTLEWVEISFDGRKSESEVAQSRLTLSDPMDCSLPGSSAHGIFQARVLEWVAISKKCGVNL